MWYDLFTLALLIAAAVRGAVRGFVWQLAGIAAVVLSFVFATPLSRWLAPYIGLGPSFDRAVAMLLLYVAFAFLGFAVARALRDLIEKVRLVDYDRHLGTLFGLVKGAAVSVVLTFFLLTLVSAARPFVLGSVSGSAAAWLLDSLRPVMPAELHRVLDPSIQELEDAAPDALPSPRRRKRHPRWRLFD